MLHDGGAALGAEPGEGESAQEVESDGDGGGPHEQEAATNRAEAPEFADEPARHDGGLDGAHAAAGFLDFDKAGGKLDGMTLTDGFEAEEVQAFGGDGGDEGHQVVHERNLDDAGPRDGEEEQGEGGEEMTHPGRATPAGD